VNQAVLYPVEHEPLPTMHGHPGGYELRYSARGHPFYVWSKPVPRIMDWVLDSVVYLYPSKDDADAGVGEGGTGFLVWVPSEVHEDYGFVYCVTNSHVIREAASPVIRINTKDGGRDILEYKQEDWTHHQDGDDIAVCPLIMSREGHHKFNEISFGALVTEEFMEQQSFGPGDEVFMVGRFAAHEGRRRNTPSVRFGNISMMPDEPIMHERGYPVDSFLVETCSLSGYSGSPVFVYHAPTTPYPVGYPSRVQGFWLLGVDWGHLPINEKVRWKDDKSLVDENWIVESNSGQMAVSPAWKLQELLNQGDLPTVRKHTDDELTKRKESSPVVLDMQNGDVSRSNQDAADAPTRDDFFRDTRNVDRQQDRPSRPDQE
jgi:hypothetical protein